MQNVTSAITCDTNCTCSNCCEDIILDQDSLKLQSDILTKASTTGNDSQESGVVSFDDNKAGEAIDLPTSRRDNARVGQNLDLSKYLTRPVNIYNYTWAVGGTTSANIAPWQLFLNHTSIRKKIDNYYLLRANLHLKFVINAAPFYYGCMLVAYNPLTKFKNPYIGTTGDINIPLSQLPRGYLYPSASQGASMVIPFVYYRDWLDITSNTDVTDMGTLYFQVLDSLKNSNGATAGINIQVYAWMEDIELSGATVGLALQSGKDEYGINNNNIKPSNTISVSADIEIPHMAKATTIINKIGTDAAHALGFTNVPVIDPVHAFVPQPFPHMSSTDIGTPMEKLTLDSKNELSIDPKVAGADFNDELLVKNIVCRESYLDQFPWTVAASPDQLLFSSRVSPNLFQSSSQASQYQINGTPMWMVSQMFRYWKGDITFRFKIISSQFHRGRLRFSWDPNGAISTTTDSTTEVYTKIVDIADSTDVSLTIPYMQPYQWSRNVLTTTEQHVIGSGALARNPFYDNGVLTVRVLTELTAPITTADINVLVFVSGTEKLEFAVPTDIDNGNRLSPFTVQSGVHTDTLAYDNEDHNESCIGLTSYTKTYDSNDTYVGESVRSLRTLLRRPNTYITAAYTGSTSATPAIRLLRSLYNRYPLSPGFDPNGFLTATGPVSGLAKAYNAVPYNTITWLGQCFLGCRGSIVYHCNPLDAIPTSSISIVRSPDATVTAPTSDYLLTSIYSSSSINNVSAIALYQTNAACGMNLTNNRTKAGNSASLPFYSKYKFRTSSPADATLGSATDESTIDTFYVERIIQPAANNVSNGQQYSTYMNSMYVAAGTDFSFVFFLAVPTLFYYSAIPTIP